MLLAYNYEISYRWLNTSFIINIIKYWNFYFALFTYNIII